MTPAPLVSVIIPVFNGERYLQEAIQSVIDQSYRSKEIIVIDDGSTDGSQAMALQYAATVYVHSQSNQGLGAARNTGLQHAHGTFVAFLDHDDVWMPDKLSQQVLAFHADPTVEMVFGHVEEFFSPELSNKERQKIRCLDGPSPGYVAGSLLVRKAVFDRIGLFDTTCRVGEFVDWYLRARDAGLSIQMMSDTVLRRRLHRSNMTLKHRDQFGGYTRVLKMSLDRRRGKATNDPGRGTDDR